MSCKSKYISWEVYWSNFPCCRVHKGFRPLGNSLTPFWEGVPPQVMNHCTNQWWSVKSVVTRSVKVRLGSVLSSTCDLCAEIQRRINSASSSLGRLPNGQSHLSSPHKRCLFSSLSSGVAVKGVETVLTPQQISGIVSHSLPSDVCQPPLMEQRSKRWSTPKSWFYPQGELAYRRNLHWFGHTTQHCPRARGHNMVDFATERDLLDGRSMYYKDHIKTPLAKFDIYPSNLESLANGRGVLRGEQHLRRRITGGGAATCSGGLLLPSTANASRTWTPVAPAWGVPKTISRRTKAK